jgi:hypothetical protein
MHAAILKKKKRKEKNSRKNSLEQPFKAIQGTILYVQYKFGCHDTK